MLERFYPDLYVENVKKIDTDKLLKEGYKGLIIDIDNTLAADRCDITNDIIDWMTTVKSKGLKAVLVSNNKEVRVNKIGELLNLPTIHNASKPRRKAFLTAIDLMNIKPSEACVVGDQLFTDVYGGNRLNMYTILVMPIKAKEILVTKIKRPLEKIILNGYKNVQESDLSKRIEWKFKSGMSKAKKYFEGGHKND